MAKADVLGALGKLGGQIAGAAAAALAVAALIKVPKTVDTGSMTFPKDLNDQYYFTVNFYSYARQSLMSVGELPSAGTIRLPLPTSLSDSYNITYESEAIGTALGGGANAIMGLGAGNPLVESAGAAAASLAGSAAKKALDQLGGAGLAQAALGVTTNPFMTVLFKSPNYKEYSFSWRLFPRNRAESDVIVNIIRAMRYHSLPGQAIGSGGSILTYPSLVKCMAKTRGGEVYPFKYGVVKNVTFNYAPDGVPSFHADGSPSAVDIKLDIQEVEYFLKEDVSPV